MTISAALSLKFFLHSPPETVCYESYVNVIDDVIHKNAYHVINCWQTSVRPLESVRISEEACYKLLLFFVKQY